MGKTLFTRQGPIFGLLESQIEQEMLTIQATQEIKNVNENVNENENESEDEEFKIHSSEKLNEAFDKEFDESGDDDDENEFGVADSSYFRFSKGGNGSFKRTRNTEICR